MSYQQDFRNLPVLITISKELVLRQFRPIASQYGLSEQFWRVIRGVYENPHITIDEICDKWQLLRPAVPGLLKHMQEKDLLTLNYETDPEEPVITLTEKSINLLKEVRPIMDKEYKKLEDKYGKELIERLFDAVEEMVQIDENLKQQVANNSDSNVYKLGNSRGGLN